MRHHARLLRTTLTASFMLLAIAGATVAGPLEDADDAYKRGDYTIALPLYRALADHGNADAQESLGAMYDRGEGTPQSYAKALKWYRRAADQGDADAQNNVGEIYHDGLGVWQSYTKALKWFRKAADQGNADAQKNLGYMYEHGEGVPQDYVQAHMWLSLAVSNFSASDKESRDKATEDRNRVASQMTSAQIAEAQKLASEWKPTPTLKPTPKPTSKPKPKR